MFAICGYNQKNKQKDDITERRLEEADIFLEVKSHRNDKNRIED